MSDKTIAAQGYRLRRAEADAKGAKRWKRRAEKAEAERDEAKRELVAAVAHVKYWRESVTEALNRPPEYWYDRHENGRSAMEHAVYAIEALFAERDSERARADRYLAAMREYVEARIADGVCIPSDPDAPERFPAFERTVRATQAIRAIIEEARRG